MTSHKVQCMVIAVLLKKPRTFDGVWNSFPETTLWQSVNDALKELIKCRVLFARDRKFFILNKTAAMSIINRDAGPLAIIERQG